MRSTNSTNSNFGEVLVLEQHISSLKDRITKEQEKEIKRITHECSINNYEGRFRTSLKDLLSAIIGVESVDKYMVLVIKEQRDIVSRMENTKTFTFSTK